MERFRRILHQLLFPGLAVVLVSVPVAAVLLIYTFVSGHEDTPAAYLSYGISAYSLTIVCIWTAKNAAAARDAVKTSIHKNRLVHRYLTDIPFKMHVSLYFSLGLNLMYAVMKLFLGAYYSSVWFGTLAVYYIMLAIMRFLLLRHVNRAAIGSELVSEWKRYRLCGVILMLMNIALSGVVVLVVRRNEGFEYAGYLIYVMAMYAFYNIITAVMNIVKYRKFMSPVMSAAKAIKLVTALVSMLSLETAMLAQFDNGKNPALFRRTMTGATGGGVCLAVLGMAVYMVIRSTKELERFRSSEAEV